MPDRVNLAAQCHTPNSGYSQLILLAECIRALLQGRGQWEAVGLEGGGRIISLKAFNIRRADNNLCKPEDNIYIHKPLNDVTSLTAWKSLQSRRAYITTLIISLHRHPYELRK
jgi:hypothetical protein